MAFSLNLGALAVTLGLDTDPFEKGVKQAKSSWGSLKGDMLSVGKGVGAGAALAAGGVALVAKAAGDLEMELTKAASVSAEGMKAFDGFKQAALSASAGSMSSATEAAQALKFLAMAGFSAKDAMTALPGVIQLSAAAGVSLATASDIASDTLSGFGLKAQDLAHVNDVLTLGFNRTNTSLELLFESMKYVGPVAQSAGQSIETMTAAVGLMSNVGIKGSQAGTSMRMALLRLQDPPKKAREALAALGIEVVGANGKMRDFVDIIADFEKAQSKMGQADYTSKVSQVVGAEAVSGFLGVINQGSEALRKLRDEMVSANGTTADLEKQMMATFSGQWQVFTGNIENLMAMLGGAFLPLLGSLTKELTGFVTSLQQDEEAAAQFSNRINEMLPLLGASIELAALAVQGFARLAGVIGESANGYSILALAAKRFALEQQDRDTMFNTFENAKVKEQIQQVEAQIERLGDRTGTIYEEAAQSADRFADASGRVADIISSATVKLEVQTKKVKTQEEAIKDATKALSDYGAQWRGIGEGSNFVEQPRWMLGPQNRFKSENTKPPKPPKDSSAAKRSAEERAQAKIREEIAAMELDALRTRDELVKIDKQAQADIEALRLRQLGTLEKELAIAEILVRAEREKEGWIKKQADEMERRAAAEKKANEKTAKEMVDMLDIEGTDAKKKAKGADDRSKALKSEERQAREAMAEAIGPMISLGNDFADMLGEFGGTLKKILGIGSAALEGFVEGGAMGALQGGLMALASSVMDTIGQSQAFQDNMTALGTMFEGLGIGDLIDSFFKSFQPAIGAILSVFKSFGGMNFDGLFESLGRGMFATVKSFLMGILTFKEVFAWAGYMQQKILRDIALVLHNTINKVAEFIDDIPGFDRPDTSAVNNFYRAVNAGAEEAQDELDAIRRQKNQLAGLTYDQGQAIFDETMERKKSAEAMRELNDELRNAPAGFKIALARFNAQDAAAGAAGGGNSTRQQGLSVGNVMVFGDPATLLSGLSRRQFISTGTTSPVVQRYAASLASRP